MENLLEKVIGECGSGNKYATIRQAATDVQNCFLKREDEIGSKLETYELREKCLNTIELLLDSKQPRLVNLGTKALQAALTDHKLRSSSEDKEIIEQRLPLQLIHTLHDLPFWSHDPNLQCHCFTILLQLTSSVDFVIDFNVIRSVIELCISTFTGSRNQACTEMAARATIIQTLNSFCTKSIGKTGNGTINNEFCAEMVEILSFFCAKLKSIASSPQYSAALLLMLDSVQAVLSSQDNVIPNPFADLLWQELVPLLINILGDPNHISLDPQTSISSAPAGDCNKGRGVTHASNNLLVSQSCDVAKALYVICEELLRLLGSQLSMRSVLEALFHRMLLFPAPEKRLDALRALKNIMSNPLFMTSMAFFNDNAGKFDTGLWKIFIDALVECSSVDPSDNIDLIWTSTRCVSTFINSLAEFCEQNKLDASMDDASDPIGSLCHIVNKCFPNLEDVEGNIHSESENKLESFNETVINDSQERLDCSEEKDICNSLSTLANQLDSKLVNDGVEDGVVQYLSRIRRVWQSNVYSESCNPVKSTNIDPKFLRKTTSFDNREFSSAKRYVELFCARLSDWNNAKSTIELDVQLQNFALETFEDFMLSQLKLLKSRGSTYEIAVYNVDALYLLTYSTLYLYLQVLELDTANDKRITVMSESEFINRVVDVGIIVYVSVPFLKALYSLIVGQMSCLFGDTLTQPSAMLTNLIEDYSGRNGQVLTDFSRLDQSAHRRSFISERYAAATKIARILLVTSWEEIVLILSKPFQCKEYSSQFNIEASKGHRGSLDLSAGILDGLDGLQKLLVLCPKLGLTNRSNQIFRLLVETSCPLEELRSRCSEQFSKQVDAQNSRLQAFSAKLPFNANTVKSHLIIHPSHALSMQLLLDCALKAGSLDKNCWSPFLRCIDYITEFETEFFISSQKGDAGKKIKQVASCTASRFLDNESNITDSDNCGSEDDLAFILPSSPIRFSEDVAETIRNIMNDNQKKSGRKTNNDYLYMQITARVLTVLSAKIERFYDDCSRCLNLSALQELCKALIASSQSNLFYGSIPPASKTAGCAFIEQLSRIMIRVAKSGRSLIHIVTLWGIIAPHFVEAACANNPIVSHRSVELLRDCVSALLENISGFELKNFHFNETLLQPFQTILCLELCDQQCADSILCTIAELVESYKQEIYTGWRSLFGALRAARNHFLLYGSDIPVDNIRHLHNALVDVFSTFLKSDNAKTFCRASGECISCLLRFLIEENQDGSKNNIDVFYEGPSVSCNDGRNDVSCDVPNFAKTALCFLRQCHSLLVSMYEICSEDVLVHLMHRLTQKDHTAECIDHEISGVCGINLPSLASVLVENQQTVFGWTFSPYFLELRLEEQSLPLPWQELPIGKRLICEAWVDLVDGLIGCIINTSVSMQPEVTECVYDILEMMLSVPGLEFGTYCLNHILLPTLQRWLRRETADMQDHNWRENRAGVRNFKHCIGLLVEVVCTYVKANPSKLKAFLCFTSLCNYCNYFFVGAPCNRLLLIQTLDILVECASTSSEFVARLGCSSLRHLIESLKEHLTVEHWSCICRCLWRFCSVTLHPLRALMNCFEKDSTRYDGDVGKQVQVAIRRDSNPTEAARLRILAQQVFLADCQKYEQNLEDRPDKLSQSYRSVVFLLNSVDKTDAVMRLPFRKIVVGLLAHQLYLQLVGSLLCDGSNVRFPSSCTTLTRHLTTYADKVADKTYPGCLNYLNDEQICSLLCCLDASFAVALQFNARPGLKFLIQKVFSSPVTPNLYKNLVTCWTYQALTLFHLGSDSFAPNDGCLWSPNSQCTGQRAWPELDGIVIDFQDLISGHMPRYLFYARILSLRYARICCFLCKLEDGNADRDGSSEESMAHLEFLAENDEDSDAKSRDISVSRSSLSDDKPDSSSDQEYPEKNKIKCKSQEIVYSLASAAYIKNCLEDFKKAKSFASKPRTSKNTNCTNEKNCHRLNPFHNDQLAAIKSAEDQSNFDDYEDSSLKQEALLTFAEDKQTATLAWSEMVVSLPTVVITVDDHSTFKRMLPLVFSPLTRTAAISNSKSVKLLLVDLLWKLSDVFQFFNLDDSR